MIFQALPFEEAKINDELYTFIAREKSSFYWSIYENNTPVSEELKDLFIGMVNYESSARLTLEEIFAHPWVNGPVPS